MAKAYYLVYQDDFDSINENTNDVADVIESRTGLKCEDYIFFDDDDQITPYIAY